MRNLLHSTNAREGQVHPRGPAGRIFSDAKRLLTTQEPRIAFLTDFESHGAGNSVYRMKSAAQKVYDEYGERLILPLRLLGSHRPLALLDINHRVPLGNVLIGAVRLHGALCEATEPVGTIYVAVVDPGVGTERRSIIAKTKRGKVLVGPDNGLLSLVLAEEGVAEARLIENRDLTCIRGRKSDTFHGKDVFAPVAVHLAKGVPLAEFGGLLDPETLIKIKISGDALYGKVLDVDDTAGNLRFSNPSDGFVDKLGRKATVSIRDDEAGGKELASETAVLASNFEAVGVGDPLLIFGSARRLELAVNRASASARYGINEEDVRLRTGSLEPRLSIEVRI